MTGAPYVPFMEPRTARPPGLSPLDPAAWIALDPDFAAQMAARDALVLGGAPDVVAALPGSDAAAAELLAALLAHLADRPAWRVGPAAVDRPDGARVALEGPPLAVAARLVAEDLLLLAPGPAEHRLVAGALCFPSHWSLGAKLGRPLTEIHDPVPGYAETLAARVNRVFAALAAGRPLVRVNWMATPSPALRQTGPHRRARRAPPDGSFWLRTERQTLTRLPASGAVVFAIKTTLTPFAALTQAQARALRDGLAAYPAAQIAYRGGPAPHRAAIAALEALAVSPA